MDYISLIINLIIAIVVAVITAQLSIKEFYKQEIWLRKEDRYSEIIKDLSILQKYYGDIFDEALGILGANGINDFLENEHKMSIRRLELVVLSQGFILKKEALQTLQQLFISSKTETDDERMGNYVGYFDRMYGETKHAKDEIIKIANEDLGL